MKKVKNCWSSRRSEARSSQGVL